MSEVIVNYPVQNRADSLPLFTESYQQTTERLADTITSLGQLAINFARVERVPRYHETHRENDAEHTFMLGLIAPEVAYQFYPHLDYGLVGHFCTSHDLIEEVTKDVATFNLDDAALARKETTEHDALEDFVRRLPPFTAQMVRRYESQREPEARFVRMLDKIVPVVVDILGAGSKVMHEDYGIYTQEQLDVTEQRLRTRLKNTFTEPELQLLHDVRTVLADRFSAQFQPNLATSRQA